MKLIGMLFLGTSSAFAVVGNLTGHLGSMVWAASFGALSLTTVIIDAYTREVSAS